MHNEVLWHPDVDAVVKISEGPIGLDTEFVANGSRWTVTLHHDEFVPGESLGNTTIMTGGTVERWSATFAPAPDGGTFLTQKLEIPIRAGSREVDIVYAATVQRFAELNPHLKRGIEDYAPRQYAEMTAEVVQPKPSHVFPMGTRINERGRVEIGGCDTIELAREFGTPAYIVAEDDLRSRARAFREACSIAGGGKFNPEVVFASKAWPCTPVLSILAEEGLMCDVASSGEFHIAQEAGFDPGRIVFHGNAKSEAELNTALDSRVRLIVVDSFDEIDRLELLLSERPNDGVSQAVLIRVTPDVAGDTHDKISTGQADSKFGFAIADVPRAIARINGIHGLELQGVHAHIGSQLLELEPFRREVKALSALGQFSTWDLGGGLGVAYTSDQHPPSIQEYVDALVDAARENGIVERAGNSLLIEPGRSLVANSCVTLYTVQSVKQNASLWVAVDGGMSDNLRPALYGSKYEAHVTSRFGGDTRCVLAGKHCESGDVIVREALLDDPRVGDVIVTPATGAYGYAMANNYNGALRPPVIFCKDGNAVEVVRRETHGDLTARDVPPEKRRATNFSFPGARSAGVAGP
jgi:diaminopimelate decarboxylase